jgi:UDP-N-acetyl-D-mannosaminuronate dehydrogenase
MENIDIKKKKVAVIGLGYVGLPLALLADRKGYKVIGIDRDENKIKKINEKIAPYEDANISKYLKASTLIASTDWEQMKDCSTVVVCVPTPVDHHYKPDLEPVKSSVIQIAKHLQKGQLIVLESTVNPGDKNWNVENIPRVIGSMDPIGLKKGVDFYKSIVNAEIKPMGNIKEAEAVKIVENSFRDINIAFVNELAQSFHHLGIDVVNVIRGAATKPFSFLAHFPSCGVGGHCIPVDPYYLIDYAKRNGYNHRFLSLARRINNGMPMFTVNLLETLLEEKSESLVGSKITVLGLAYKANIDDCRESPAFQIIKHLEKKGAQVTTYDPFVKNRSTATNLQEAIQDAKAVVIATAHNKFKFLSPSFFLKHNVSVVVDGQNCLPKEKFLQAGIMYKGIGRHNLYR